jgi:tetratricopeptide (TPR) repeat protein
MLRRAGCHERAIVLLETALREETRPVERLSVLERLSSILEEIGDHLKGAAILEPLLGGDSTVLSPRDAVRLRRRLGVHLHRSGRAEEALRVFEEAERLADPKRDIEDLIFIDSEMAELCTLRGLLDRAEEACRRGLDRLAKLAEDGPARGGDFRDRMEVILCASQGHLHLRRFRLSEACAEFRKALRRSRRFRIPGIRAVILNNFGIALNQLNRFAEACRALREAGGGRAALPHPHRLQSRGDLRQARRAG